MTDTTSAQQRIARAIELTRKEQYEEALELFDAHLPTLTSGTLEDKRVAAGALSFYGVCVAKVRRKYGEAVKYCNISVRSNMFDPDHRYNLALVYLERDDRRRAVESLSAGLKLKPGHPGINRIFDTIGRRRKPVISFLPRDNPINVWLGRKRRGKG